MNISGPVARMKARHKRPSISSSDSDSSSFGFGTLDLSHYNSEDDSKDFQDSQSDASDSDHESSFEDEVQVGKAPRQARGATRQFTNEEKGAALRMRQDGDSITKVCRIFGCSATTLKNWQRRLRETGSVGSKARSGRPRKLAQEDVQNMVAIVQDDPLLTQRQISAKLEGKVAKRTVGDYMQREGFTLKRTTQLEPKYPTPNDIVEIKAYYEAVAKIPLEKRVYMDESFLHDNFTRNVAWSLKGKPATVQKKRHGQRSTLWAAIRYDGFVHDLTLTRATGNSETFESYVKEILAPNLKEGDVVIWDRLGRSGLAKNPTAQHFSPIAKSLIEDRGSRIVFLPPKGKFFNPIEMVFGGLKKFIETSEWCRQAAKDARCMTEFEMKKALDAGAEVVKHQIKGYFKERGGLTNFGKHYDVKLVLGPSDSGSGDENVILDCENIKKERTEA